jgi:hypothetical protein
MRIAAKSMDEMIKIVAGLVREGLTFETFKNTCDTWIIELTGGF